MHLTPLGEIALTYVGPGLDFVEFGAGGQYYANMQGNWTGDRIVGRLRLTNTPAKRPDNINVPTIRGILDTADGAKIFVEMNGLAQLEWGGRVFICSLTLRTGDARYAWVNTLFGLVEGALYGAPRPNEFGARCRVYACEATIRPTAQGGDRSMRAIAYAMPVLPGREDELLALAGELDSKSSRYDSYRRRIGVAREAAFLQRTPVGSQLIMYREFDDSARPTQPQDDSFDAWLGARLQAVHGFDPNSTPQKVEVLVDRHPFGRWPLYAAALPVAANKVGRLHEWIAELNGIHATEFDEALRRLRHGLTLFAQYTPQGAVTISVVDGDEPEAALARMAMSDHPFDRWHLQTIAGLTGLEVSGPLPPLNQRLWAWQDVPVGQTT